VAACLALAGCGADDEAPVRAEGPTATTTADPSPSTPTGEPTEPAPQPSAAPSSEPAPEAPETGRTDRVPPRDPVRPPGRDPLPAPSDRGSAPRTPSSPGPSPSAPGPTAQPKPPPEEVGGPAGALAFGQAYTWDNGLTVSVSRPDPMATQEGGPEEGTPPPSEPPPDGTDASAGTDAQAGTDASAAPEPSGTATARPASTAPPDKGTIVAVDLVLTNGTDRPVNTSIFVVMTSGGVDAPSVYDPDAGLTGPPGTMIQPGKSARFTMGFEAQDPEDLTLEIRPAYQYVSALFVHPSAAQG
jgi:hypothetical protein